METKKEVEDGGIMRVGDTLEVHFSFLGVKYQQTGVVDQVGEHGQLFNDHGVDLLSPNLGGYEVDPEVIYVIRPYDIPQGNYRRVRGSEYAYTYTVDGEEVMFTNPESGTKNRSAYTVEKFSEEVEQGVFFRI